MTADTDAEMKSMKIVLGGRWGVGKTSLRRKYMGKARFKRNYLPTVGSDFSYKDLKMNSQNIRILLWDLAGEVRFRKFRSLYFQGAVGAILVFDLTDEASFANLDEWVEDLKNETETNGIPLLIVGNKADLILDSSELCVPMETLEMKLEEYREMFNHRFTIPYMEVSALSGKNVDDAFEMVINEAMQFT